MNAEKYRQLLVYKLNVVNIEMKPNLYGKQLVKKFWHFLAVDKCWARTKDSYMKGQVDYRMQVELVSIKS